MAAHPKNVGIFQPPLPYSIIQGKILFANQIPVGEDIHAVRPRRQELFNVPIHFHINDLAFKVKTAGMLKRSLTEIDRLGGDYVQTLIAGAE